MNIRRFLSKRSIIILIIIAVIIVVAAKRGGEKEPGFDFVIAERGSIAHEVSVTGNVKAAQSVDLAFEISGRVARILANVGDTVQIGSQLITLQSGVLSAQLLQAQANLEAERALLNELKKGTRIEELKSAETTVENAKRVLADERINLTNVKEKADADLNSDYDAALTTLQKAVSVGKTALISLTDIQYARFLASDENGTAVTDAKRSAVRLLLGASSAGQWSSGSIAELSGGAFGDVQNAVNDSSHAVIDTALQSTMSALQSVKSALGAVPITDAVTSAERTSLSAEKTNVVTEITNVSSKEQTIAVQKISNQNSIAAAQESVNSAQNALLSATDTLTLKRAGSTPESIAAQDAKVKSARANVQNYQAQIGKTILHSPIVGVVTVQDAKVGEIIAANAHLVSIISEADFEIEANIAEVDISQVKIGDTADVTLDAYGSDELFAARVIAIDPAETVIDGVSTYKVTLQFNSPDPRIRSGMTANTDVLTATRENVITIPQRAVIRENGDRVVKVLVGEIMEKIVVETGLRGSRGNIEIISGINEGDKVITFIKD